MGHSYVTQWLDLRDVNCSNRGPLHDLFHVSEVQKQAKVIYVVRHQRVGTQGWREGTTVVRSRCQRLLGDWTHPRVSL